MMMSVLAGSWWIVLSLLHAPHMLELARNFLLTTNFYGVICGGGGQGQVPQRPLLDEILRLLRNGGRIHQMGWRVIGSHVIDVGGRDDGDVGGRCCRRDG